MKFLKKKKELSPLGYLMFKFIIVLPLSFIVGWFFSLLIVKWDNARAILGLPEKDKPDYFMEKYFDSRSYLAPQDPPNAIILVEAGDLKRSEVANLLYCLDSLDPAVIGLDIMYSDTSNKKEDACLLGALRECGATHKIVLPEYYDGEYFDGNPVLRAPFFYDSVMPEKLVYGMVNFDNPWDFSSMQSGKYTFVYQLAQTYLERNGGSLPDTANLIVDYRPMDFKVIKYKESGLTKKTTLTKYKGHFTLEDIKNNVVVIGTMDRDRDPLFMRFHVMYDNLMKTTVSNRVPGMTVIAYQVNSLIEPKEKQMKRVSGFFDFFNFIVNFLMIFGYMILYYIIDVFDMRCQDSSKKFYRVVRVMNPFIRFLLLVIAEIILINRTIMPIVDNKSIMPNIMIAMIALPLVSCFNICLERFFEAIGVRMRITNTKK